MDHLDQNGFSLWNMKLVLLDLDASPMSVLIFRSWQHYGGVARCCRYCEFYSSYNPLFCTLVDEFTVAANLREPEHRWIRPDSQLISQCLPWAKSRLHRKLMVAVRQRRTIVHSLPPSCTSPTTLPKTPPAHFRRSSVNSGELRRTFVRDRREKFLANCWRIRGER